MIVKIPVNKFSESKALRINKVIIPKEIDIEIGIFLKKILKVQTSAKYSGIKKRDS